MKVSHRLDSRYTSKVQFLGEGRIRKEKVLAKFHPEVEITTVDILQLEQVKSFDLQLHFAHRLLHCQMITSKGASKHASEQVNK